MLTASGAVLCALAAVSAAVALPSATQAPKASARCAPLTLAPGGAGLLRLIPAKGSLPIATSKLAGGVKATTKQRKITRVRATAFRYAFRLKTGVRGESVRISVGFGKGGKVQTTKVVTCVVRVGAAKLALKVTVSGPGSVKSTPAGITCTLAKSPCTASFKRNTKVKLTATAETTADFAGWGGTCKGTAGCTVTLKAARKVAAAFTRKKFTVTVQKAGDGGGTVTATEGSVACGATCAGTYDAGDIVRLRAEADGASRFVGWTGTACSSTASQCIFTVDGATTVTATFAKQGFRMNVSRAGDGGGTITGGPAGIDCGATCSFTYPAGTAVTLTATPDATSIFTGWITNGDCVVSGNTCTTTMDNAKFIAAAFVRGVTITVAVNTEHPTAAGTGPGTIVANTPGFSCSTGQTCSGLFLPNAIIRFSASSGSLRDWYRCEPPDQVTTNATCEGLGSELAGRTIVAHFN